MDVSPVETENWHEHSLTLATQPNAYPLGPVRLTKAVERYLAVGHNGYTDEYGISYPEVTFTFNISYYIVQRNDMSLRSITVL
jgi:hypothetical protein